MSDRKFKNANELTQYLLSGNANLRFTLEQRLGYLEEMIYSLQDQVNNLMNYIQHDVNDSELFQMGDGK